MAGLDKRLWDLQVFPRMCVQVTSRTILQTPGYRERPELCYNLPLENGPVGSATCMMNKSCRGSFMFLFQCLVSPVVHIISRHGSAESSVRD